MKEYLDIREINGYSIHYTPFYPASSTGSSSGAAPEPIRTLVYIGTPDNDQFMGPQHVQELAEHIYRSEGPSGLNRDYLLGLEEALNKLSPESGDEHVTDLSNRLRGIMAREEAAASKDGGDVEAVVSQASAASHHGFERASSIDEQEETEKTR